MTHIWRFWAGFYLYCPLGRYEDKTRGVKRKLGRGAAWRGGLLRSAAPPGLCASGDRGRAALSPQLDKEERPALRSIPLLVDDNVKDP